MVAVFNAIRSEPSGTRIQLIQRSTDTPITRADFSALRDDIMRHIFALEVLLSLLLFNIVLLGAYLTLRYLWHARRRNHALLPSSNTTSPPVNGSSKGVTERSRTPRASDTTQTAISGTLESSQPATPPSRVRTFAVNSSKTTLPARGAQSSDVGVLDSELTSHPIPTVSQVRRSSFPRSAWGASTDAQSAADPMSGYPRLSSFLNRLQHTYPQQDLVVCKASFTAQDLLLPLDELRGTTAGSLRAKGMPSAQADFLARAIVQELEWIESDRDGGGNGFRMVLNA